MGKDWSREQLLNEARRRGRLWAEHKQTEFGGIVRGRWPAMTNNVTNRECYQRVADLLPLNPLGEEVALACYEAARDAFHEMVAHGLGAYVEKQTKR